jgi:SAM-dependent methyltransferase
VTEDARLYAPSTARNSAPILGVLQMYLPERGLILEVASGSGEHIVQAATATAPDLVFQPTDLDPAARASVDAWTKAAGVTNVLPALALDAAAETWPVLRAEGVMCINMIHIAPWSAAEGLVRGAARVLSPGGFLYLYGPYKRDGRHSAESNAGFDAWLKSQSPDYGVRDLETVVALAKINGLGDPEIIEMPANNLSVVFQKMPA